MIRDIEVSFIQSSLHLYCGFGGLRLLHGTKDAAVGISMYFSDHREATTHINKCLSPWAQFVRAKHHLYIVLETGVSHAS